MRSESSFPLGEDQSKISIKISIVFSIRNQKRLVRVNDLLRRHKLSITIV